MEYAVRLYFLVTVAAVKRFFAEGYFIPVFGLIGFGYVLGKLF